MYDPAFSYEIAVIVQHGLKCMIEEQQDCFYYLTVMNENYSHPTIPESAEEGIIKGMYLLQKADTPAANHLQLLGSGAILREVIAAAEILARDYKVSADIWSVTSFTELAREAETMNRHNRLHPSKKPEQSYVQKCLQNTNGSVIAATDYVRTHAEQIRAYIDKPYTVLGTDGFGRSDTRKKLRHFFEVDAKFIVLACLKQLWDEGSLSMTQYKQALKSLDIDQDKANPLVS